MLVQIIVGSIRANRVSAAVAAWVGSVAIQRSDIDVEIVDLADWPLPLFGLAEPPRMGVYPLEMQRDWADTIARGDAYLFVTPEYNHAYPAVLKNAIDYLDQEWRRKPAAFIGIGNAFGARAIEQLSLVLIELGMAPLASGVKLLSIHQRIHDGRFDGDVDEELALARELDNLVWWSRALVDARREVA